VGTHGGAGVVTGTHHRWVGGSPWALGRALWILVEVF